MPAEVETIMQAGNLPLWWGLGNPVGDAQNSTEALISSGLNWNVLSKPVVVDGKEVEGFKANVRDIDGSVLGIVSDRYKIVQNSEAFSFMDILLGEGVLFETAGSLFKGKKIWLLARTPSQWILDDEIAPYVAFTTGHDGGHATQACPTPTRIVCNNTCNLAFSTAKRVWTMRHTGNIEAKRFEALRVLDFMESYMKQFKVTAEEMAVKSVSVTELEAIIEQMFPVDEEASNCVKKNTYMMRNTFMDIYTNTEDLLNFKGTQWGIYQAFSDMATHMTPLRQTKNFKEKRFASFLDGNLMLDKVQRILQAA